jgi:Tol biopolymer transport system component
VIAISPDGARVAYVADAKLFVRGLDQLDATPMTTVADPIEPFFSPDGQWIGFFGEGHLQKVAISGGAPVRIAPADMPLGASWSGDFIVFGQDGGIMRVPATGGKPELVVPNQGEERLANPSLVQSGRFMLFTRARRDSVASMQWDDAEIVFEELSTHARRTAVRGGTDARWLEPNYLVYSRRSEILATAVDPRTLEPRGTPVMLVTDVARALGGATGSQQFSAARDGTLVYVKGLADDLNHLAWMRIGRTETTDLETGHYLYPRPSPRDGSRIAFADGISGETDVFVLEWARKAKVRVTTSPATDTSPVWTPDGRRLVYSMCSLLTERASPNA